MVRCEPYPMPPSGTRLFFPHSWWRSKRSLTLRHRRLENCGLNFEQILHSCATELNQSGKLRIVECDLFGYRLQLDKSAGAGHYDVHIHSSAGVFFVIQIE